MTYLSKDQEMKSMINIRFASEETLETIKKNISKVTQLVRDNPSDNSWVYSYLPKDPFVAKKFKIEDFDLEMVNDSNYKENEFKNSITLYEHLHQLPMYVLTDERFWLWLYLEKFYEITVKMMPIKTDSTIKDHWLFTQGNRRGIFFGVLSRSFFRVFFSVDETLEDKYELTKFVIDNPERFRNLTWRSFSSQKKLVLGILKAEKRIEEEYEGNFSSDIYPEIAKYVGRYGSVRLLDSVSEAEIESVVYQKMKEILGAKENNETIR